MTPAKKLVGLIGRRGSGKDTAASVLEAHGFQNVKFAGALKAMLRTLLAYQGADELSIDRMIDGDLKEVPTPLLAGRTPRYAMQTLGTEWGRKLMDPDFWIGTTMAKAKVADTVITDIRFQNEIDEVHNAGGSVIRISVDGDSRFTDADAGQHASETEMDALPADAEITNRMARPGEVVEQVIQEFKCRFLHLVDRSVGVLRK